MTKTAPLDERIATALAGRPTSVELASLLAEATVADHQAEVDAAQASEVALDPATAPVKVAEARQLMSDAQFTRDRLANATKRLEDLRQEAVRTEREAERQTAVAALTQRRDALVTELRATYPDLVGRLSDLLHRVVAIDAECTQFNVETVARPGHLGPHDFYPRLTSSRLVNFEKQHDGWLWVDGSPGKASRLAATPSAPIKSITMPTVRVILTNTQKGPRGFFDADLKQHQLEPGETSPEMLLTAADLAGVHANFAVRELGPGAPATRRAA